MSASSFLGESWAMTRRNLTHTLRSPDAIIVTIALPVLMLLLFVYVLGGAMNVGTSYLSYVVPGIILLCAGVGAGATAPNVTADVTTGFMARFRTLPVARSALLVGHIAESLLRNIITTAIVIGIAVGIGYRADATAIQWCAALGVVVLFVLALTIVAVALGLLAKTPVAAQGFTFFLIFLPYLSSAFVPTDTMPHALRLFAQHQPATPIIETVRDLLDGAAPGHTLLVALSWCAGIASVGFIAASALFTRRTTSSP
ncbi:ABC transporter permease [Mycolicibacterium mageritense]|uniref:ABC transporter permease n=1 Tax=Mycolicibacterium mageritense TaxID=53462 RepID=UPI001E4C22DC|nr:ABC transporter permease [Mycolicibacterium mageritense]MCC9186126.1 ABC transporter permease [Mycolicibacterium mageritense]